MTKLLKIATTLALLNFAATVNAQSTTSIDIPTTATKWVAASGAAKQGIESVNPVLSTLSDIRSDLERVESMKAGIVLGEVNESEAIKILKTTKAKLAALKAELPVIVAKIEELEPVLESLIPEE